MTITCMLSCLVACTATTVWAQDQAADRAIEKILEASGVRGGLVVHLGCGDGRLTAALGASDSYLVQGLDTDPVNVARAREYLLSRDLYGKISVRTFDENRLPYIDGLVNLIVTDEPGGVPSCLSRHSGLFCASFRRAVCQ
ncbi:MAG: methyltransferase domain-containing protein [Planctomycetota bacterium]|jgi:predicted RNA methylase